MCETRVRQWRLRVCVYTLVLVVVWQYHELLELSAVQSAVRVNYTCQLCVRSYAACSARSGRRSSSAGPCVCVCVWRLECRSFIHYRLSRRAAGVGMRCSAVQSPVQPCVWPCPRHAMSRYRQLRRSAMTLITSATAAVASLDRASPCAWIRIYAYTLHWLTVCLRALHAGNATAAAAALASVSLSVSGDCC